MVKSEMANNVFFCAAWLAGGERRDCRFDGYLQDCFCSANTWSLAGARGARAPPYLALSTTLDGFGRDHAAAAAAAQVD